MNVPLSTWITGIYMDSISTISSQESEDGVTHSGSEDGQTISQCGQQVYPVNHSAQPVKVLGKPTNDTCCRTSSNLSGSADLTLSLVSKLKERLPTGGSMIYKQQWKQKTTPSGIAYWAHTASARRTSDNDCTGWPTPKTVDENNSRTCRPQEYSARQMARENCSSELAHYAQHLAAGYQTPKASDGLWSTPRTTGRPMHKATHLQTQAISLFGSNAETGNSGQLNPAFSRWLMGFPVEWCIAAIRTHRKRQGK